MDTDELNCKAYLEELLRQTGGNPETQVSMYEIGLAIGLDRAEAGQLAEQLLVQEQVELRTLAGAISITPAGLAELGLAVAPPGEQHCLGTGPVADDQDRQTVLLLLEEVKKAMAEQPLAYRLAEEMVVDVKTLEVQLLSARPKIAVIREVFRSLADALAVAGAATSAERLQGVLKAQPR